MLSAEKYLKVLLESLFEEDEVDCTVGYPDENWVRPTGDDRLAVYCIEITPMSRVGDGAIRTVTVEVEPPEGEPEPEEPETETTEYRRWGEGAMVMEMRVRAVTETRLNELMMIVLEGICAGTTFGPDEEGADDEAFQVTEDPVARKVLPAESAGRTLEWMIRVPVHGWLETAVRKYPVEEVIQETTAGPAVEP